MATSCASTSFFPVLSSPRTDNFCILPGDPAEGDEGVVSVLHPFVFGRDNHVPSYHVPISGAMEDEVRMFKLANFVFYQTEIKADPFTNSKNIGALL